MKVSFIHSTSDFRPTNQTTNQTTDKDSQLVPAHTSAVLLYLIDARLGMTKNKKKKKKKKTNGIKIDKKKKKETEKLN